MRACCRRVGELEPALRKFIAAVSHAFSAEHAELEHFFGGEIRLELWIKTTTCSRDQLVAVTPLHSIVDYNGLRHGQALS